MYNLVTRGSAIVLKEKNGATLKKSFGLNQHRERTVGVTEQRQQLNSK